MRLRHVRVTWVDAHTEAGWFQYDPKEKLKLPLTYSTGIFVDKTKDFLILASTYDPEIKDYADRHNIPAGMVKKIKTLLTEEV